MDGFPKFILGMYFDQFVVSQIYLWELNFNPVPRGTMKLLTFINPIFLSRKRIPELKIDHFRTPKIKIPNKF